MAWVDWVLRASIAGGLAVLLGLGFVAGLHEGDAAPLALTERDDPGRVLAVPTEAGVTEARWRDAFVLLFVVPEARLEGVDSHLGEGEATPSIPLPGSPGLRMFAISGTSTHLGCSVSFNGDLGASLVVPDYDQDGVYDGRVVDVCHQMQWDPYHRGAFVAGPPGLAPLAVLGIAVTDGRIVATGFDGPVGAQR